MIYTVNYLQQIHDVKQIRIAELHRLSVIDIWL